MSKLYCAPVQVIPGPDSLPAQFNWRGHWYHVANCSMNKAPAILVPLATGLSPGSGVRREGVGLRPEENHLFIGTVKPYYQATILTSAGYFIIFILA